jgi:hypothetical protein
MDFLLFSMYLMLFDKYESDKIVIMNCRISLHKTVIIVNSSKEENHLEASGVIQS